ncbi:MAG TPA: histidine kinase [Candidatus Acidoferrales bacterium]|nr:histidine kinase [Candidatus Acidoferrales bacterium]
MRRPTLALGRNRTWITLTIVAGLVLGVLAEHLADSWLGPAWIPMADLGIGWLMIGCGLAAMLARPRQPAGRRLVVAGFLWFVGTFQGVQPPPLGAAGFAFGGYHDLVLAWLALAFPGTWPSGRLARASLAGVAVLYVAQSLARLAATAPDAFGITPIDPEVALGIVLRLDVARGASLLVVAGVLLVRLAGAQVQERRQIWPVLAAGIASAIGGAFTARYALTVLGVFPELPEDATLFLAWAFNGLRIAVPLAMLGGVLRVQGARGALTGAVGDMGATPSAGTLRDALASAFGDPQLRVMTWSGSAAGFLDSTGEPVEEGELGRLATDAALSVVRVDDGAEPLAVIVASRTATEDPALVDAAVALTRLVVRNEEQSRRIQKQLEEVRASRARIVEAADIERRRIERDLHDGLQQQMLALAMDLRAAEGDPTGREAALRRGSDGVLGVLAGVRELARGIHPAVLTEAGLGAAIRAAADRSPVPVDVDLHLPGRLPPAAEATAYFVISEALANVAKHAPGATAAWVRAEVGGGLLRVAVEDDGPGGADPDGHGLAGLADRVAALDGRFSVEGRAGGGTRIVAEVPAG